MSTTINLKGASIQHKRGTQKYWDSFTSPLLNGEIGILLDEDNIPVSLRIGDGETLFNDLPEFVNPEAIRAVESSLKSVTDSYLSEVGESDNTLIFTYVHGEEQSQISIPVGSGGGGSGGGGGSSLSKFIQFNTLTNPNIPIVLGESELSSPVVLDFEAAAFFLNEDEQIVKSVSSLFYNVYSKDSTGSYTIKLNKSPVRWSVKSCTFDDPAQYPDVDFDNFNFEDVDFTPYEEGLGYDYQHSIDFSPFLKGAKVNTELQFLVKVYPYGESEDSDYCKQVEYTFRVRAPKIETSNLQWWKPFLGEGGTIPNSLEVVYSYSGCSGASLKSFRYRIDKGSYTTIRNISGDTSYTLQLNSSSHSGLFTPGAHRLSVSVSCGEADGKEIWSPDYTTPVIIYDPNSYHITQNINSLVYDAGDNIVVPYAINVPGNITECVVSLQIIDKYSHLYGVKQQQKINSLDFSPSAPHQFVIDDYPVDSENVTFVLQLCDVSGTVHAEDRVTVTIVPSPYSSMITDIDDYAYLFNTGTVDRESNLWRTTVDSTFTTAGTLSEFNWKSNGILQDNNNRTCLRINGDAFASLSTNLFSGQQQQLNSFERTMEIDFNTPSVGDPQTRLIRCYNTDSSGNIIGPGFYITPTSIKVFGSTRTIERRFGFNERIRVSFTIQVNNTKAPFVYIYINGIMAGVVDYVPETELFINGSRVIEFGGSYISSTGQTVANDCVLDVYSVRQYNRYLTPREMLQTFIYNITSQTEKIRKYENNNVYGTYDSPQYSMVKGQIPVVTIFGYLPTYKGYKRTARIQVEYPDGRSVDFLTKYNGLDVQGTSSAGYRRKNWKVTSKKKLELIPGELSAKVFCIKVDFAEGTGTHNTQNANIVENFYDNAELGTNRLIPVKDKDLANRFHPVTVELEDKSTVEVEWKPSDDIIESLDKIRTTIAGFPVLLYYCEPDLNALYGSYGPPPSGEKDGGSESENQSKAAEEYLSSIDLKSVPDSSRIFYSKANLNFDKGAENVFGFDTPLTEEIKLNDDRISGLSAEQLSTIGDQTVEVEVPLHGIECWEFKENAEGCYFTVDPDSLDFFASYEARFHKDWDTYEDLSSLATRTEEQQNTLDDVMSTMPVNFMKLYRWVYSTNTANVKKDPDPLDEPLVCKGTYYDDQGNIVNGDYTFYNDTAGYRFTKFRKEFENHFNLTYTLIYYVYTFFALMVDQRAKNLFLTRWLKNPYEEESEVNTALWYPYFYDNDTSYGINNSGVLTLDYYNEDFDRNNGVFAAESSPLWRNFSKVFATEIQQVYTLLRLAGSGISYDNIFRHLITNGADNYSETIYNTDAQDKYIASYLEGKESGEGTENTIHNIKGPEKSYIDYFLDHRLSYCDSKWASSSLPSFRKDMCPLMILNSNEDHQSGTAGTLQLAPSIKCYVPMLKGDNTETAATRDWLPTQYADANELVTLEVLSPTEDPTNKRFYFGLPDRISRIVNVSNLPIAELYTSTLHNIEELDFSNANITKLDMSGSKPLLKTLNVSGCRRLNSDENVGSVGTLDLSSCTALEYFNCEGTPLTSVTFADSDSLKNVVFNEGIKNVVLVNQHQLESVTSNSWNNLSTIQLDDCKFEDGSDFVYSFISSVYNSIGTSQQLQSLKLNNVSLSFENINGLDTFLKNCSSMVQSPSAFQIYGSCLVRRVTTAEEKQLYSEIRSNYPNLTLSYEELGIDVTYYGTGITETYIVRSGNNNSTHTVSFSKYNSIIEPVKASSEEYKYEFIGWTPWTNSATEHIVYDESRYSYSKIAVNVRESCTVYPVFYGEKRTYRLTVVDRNTGVAIWVSEPTPYGSEVLPLIRQFNEGPATKDIIEGSIIPRVISKIDEFQYSGLKITGDSTIEVTVSYKGIYIPEIPQDQLVYETIDGTVDGDYAVKGFSSSVSEADLPKIVVGENSYVAFALPSMVQMGGATRQITSISDNAFSLRTAKGLLSDPLIVKDPRDVGAVVFRNDILVSDGLDKSTADILLDESTNTDTVVGRFYHTGRKVTTPVSWEYTIPYSGEFMIKLEDSGAGIKRIIRLFDSETNSILWTNETVLSNYSSSDESVISSIIPIGGNSYYCSGGSKVQVLYTITDMVDIDTKWNLLISTLTVCRTPPIIHAISIPGNYSNIGKGAFEGQYALTDLNIGSSSGVTRINLRDRCFADTGLSQSNIFKKSCYVVTGAKQFANTKFKELNLIVTAEDVEVTGVWSIGYSSTEGPFNGCSAVSANIKLYKSNKYTYHTLPGGILDGCRNLEKLVIKPSIERDPINILRFGRICLRSCVRLTDIQIPNLNPAGYSISMDTDAFGGVPVDDAFMDLLFYHEPYISGGKRSQVATLNGGWQFYDCKKITRVRMKGDVGSLSSGTGSMFYGCSNLTTLDLSEVTGTTVEVAGLEKPGVLSIGSIFGDSQQKLKVLKLPNNDDIRQVTIDADVFKNRFDKNYEVELFIPKSLYILRSGMFSDSTNRTKPITVTFADDFPRKDEDGSSIVGSIEQDVFYSKYNTGTGMSNHILKNVPYTENVPCERNGVTQELIPRDASFWGLYTSEDLTTEDLETKGIIEFRETPALSNG